MENRPSLCWTSSRVSAVGDRNFACIKFFIKILSMHVHRLALHTDIYHRSRQLHHRPGRSSWVCMHLADTSARRCSICHCYTVRTIRRNRQLHRFFLHSRVYTQT